MIETVSYIVDTISDVVKVSSEASGIYLINLYDWIVKQAYTTLNSIIVSRQKIVKEFIRCGNILATESFVGGGSRYQLRS